MDTSSLPDTCASCSNGLIHLENVTSITAVGLQWHLECFRCSICDIPLTNWYIVKDNMLLCENDYWSRFGKCCQQCSSLITGPVMSAGDHRFHPECFACTSCSEVIEDGESFTLVERSKLFCGNCSDSVDNIVPHAIKLIELPPVTSRASPRHIRLSRGALFKQIEQCCGVVSLKLGDKLLEINGVAIRNQPLEHLERILCCSDSNLQLIVERDPENEAIIRNELNSSNSDDCCSAYVSTNDDRSTIEKKIKLENAETVSGGVNDSISPIDIVKYRDEGDRQSRRKERICSRRSDARKRCSTGQSSFCYKERSSSLSKLLDALEGENEASSAINDLSRAKSFRTDANFKQRIFRASDLVQGELLGSGFFGQVFKVTHRQTNEVMVIKQLYRVEEEAQKNFLKEVAVLRSLSHRNVLRFIGVLYKDRRLHLVTEYVPGGTLCQLLQDQDKELSWRVRVNLALDVASGMAYLHRCNVIHRDLNSQNCLVREDNTVIVADFGLARIVERGEKRTNGIGTMSRRKRYTIVGNYYWMAPEMMKGLIYDEKVDVFSYGIVLCEIIGRVHADPDFLPRRSDFGLNETLFREKFCTGCPEALYLIAFHCCELEPDLRPSFETIEPWLNTLSTKMHKQSEICVQIRKYRESLNVQIANDCRLLSDKALSVDKSIDVKLKKVKCDDFVTKQPQTSSLPPKITCRKPSSSHTLNKCQSASHICQSINSIISIKKRCKSQNMLNAPSGYLVEAEGKNISITKLDDIREWLDPPIFLKRDKKIELPRYRRTDMEIPSFMRNQSVEELKCSKPPLPICRHLSITDNDFDKSDSDSDDSTEVLSYRNIKDEIVAKNKVKVRSVITSKLDTIENVKIREPIETGTAEMEINEPQLGDNTNEKTCFLARKLLSPKLGRLFHSKSDEKNKKRSQFFVKTPNSPKNKSNYRVRPSNSFTKHDLKVTQTLTPILKRHTGNSNFQDGRFSCRSSRHEKLSCQSDVLAELPPRKSGITKGSYVNLAKLNLSDGSTEVSNNVGNKDLKTPLERVIS